jgi:hypothetical protein
MSYIYDDKGRKINLNQEDKKGQEQEEPKHFYMLGKELAVIFNDMLNMTITSHMYAPYDERINGLNYVDLIGTVMMVVDESDLGGNLLTVDKSWYEQHQKDTQTFYDLCSEVAEVVNKEQEEETVTGETC